MSLRSLARAGRDFLQDAKNSLRIPTSWLAAKRRGDILQRTAHFAPLLADAPGASLLDLGCYDGLIAYEFFRAGARLVHGLDNDPYHLETARRIFSQVAIPSRFAHADLRRPGALARALGPAAEPRYDLVLFLGVYQHIAHRMSEEARRALVREVAARSGRLLAIRMPAKTWPEFERHFPAAEFREQERIPQEGTVGELRIWRRT